MSTEKIDKMIDKYCYDKREAEAFRKVLERVTLLRGEEVSATHVEEFLLFFMEGSRVIYQEEIEAMQEAVV
jgi:hypothetical protein